nr:hypothetical protein [Parachlamydiaceae bacterium]
PDGIVFNRGGILKFLAQNSYYAKTERMFKPDHYETPIQDNDNAVDFKWKIPLNDDNFPAYMKSSFMHVQRMIDYLQLGKNPIGRDINPKDINPGIFYDYPSNLPLLESLVSNEEITNEEGLIFLNASLEGILNNWNAQNAFIIISNCYSLRSYKYQSEDSSFITVQLDKIIVRVLEDDSLWQNSETLRQVLSFIILMKQGAGEFYPSFNNILKKLDAFSSPERLEKIRQRIFSLPIDNSQSNYYNSLYQEDRKKMIKEFL